MRFAARHRLPIVAAALAAVISFPLGAIASHQFSDVPNTNTFHNDIDAIADAGITTGCGGGKYCPDAFVTRGQMAAFLNRLGALGPGKTPVANAASAEVAGFAFDADAVDGHTAVLAAEDIVIDQLLPWLALSDPASFAIRHGAFGTQVIRDAAGTSIIVMSLQAPGAIGDTVYGLASVEICYSAADGDVTITTTTLAQATGADNGIQVAQDLTDRAMTATACYTVNDPAPDAPVGPSIVELSLSFADVGTGRIDIVRSTWTPVP